MLSLFILLLASGSALGVGVIWRGWTSGEVFTRKQDRKKAMMIGSLLCLYILALGLFSHDVGEHNRSAGRPLPIEQLSEHRVYHVVSPPSSVVWLQQGLMRHQIRAYSSNELPPEHFRVTYDENQNHKLIFIDLDNKTQED